MPELSAPGTFIKEMPVGPHGLDGVSTSTAAFVGVTTKGPFNRARVVDNSTKYSEIFGRVSAKTPLSLAVHQFFENGGKRAVIVRIKASREGRGAAIDPNQIIGDGEVQSGLYALDAAEPPGLLLTPDVATLADRAATTVSKAVVKFCKARRIFHILELPAALSKQGSAKRAVEWAKRHAFLHDANVAVYFPNLVIPDPSSNGASLSVSPSGAVAGVYARLDEDSGVWKAPAGSHAKLRNVEDVACEFARSTADQLASTSINPVMKLANKGVFVWGSRTFCETASHSEWRYVPVRRLALLLEESLYRGLRWVVFEPNDEALWAQVRLVVSSFLHQLFRSGAFQGAKPSDTYFVRCGRDTMCEADIDNGCLVLEVGFAPLKPAEFVILRIVLTGAGGGSQP